MSSVYAVSAGSRLECRIFVLRSLNVSSYASGADSCPQSKFKKIKIKRIMFMDNMDIKRNQWSRYAANKDVYPKCMILLILARWDLDTPLDWVADPCSGRDGCPLSPIGIANFFTSLKAASPSFRSDIFRVLAMLITMEEIKQLIEVLILCQLLLPHRSAVEKKTRICRWWHSQWVFSCDSVQDVIRKLIKCGRAPMIWIFEFLNIHLRRSFIWYEA